MRKIYNEKYIGEIKNTNSLADGIDWINPITRYDITTPIRNDNGTIRV